jgi:POTRA domain, FtsQ-type
VNRFARPATEAGFVEPRPGAEPGRSSRRTRVARLVGAAGMVALTAVLYWLLTDASFRVTASDVSFEGLRYADEVAVRDHLGALERQPNVFRVRASEIVEDLRTLPEVASAAATVTLPARVTVRVAEREPLFTWQDGETAWLIDEEGMLFAPLPVAVANPTADQPTETASPSPGSTDRPAGSVAADDPGLPAVEDSRLPAAPPAIGTYLPATDVAVMRQLLALTPESLGSRAGSVQLRVDEYDGYVLSSDRGWQAVFGHYTPTLQPPTVVPRQVQCLRWLLAAEEKRLERVRLAVSDDRCGTFTLFGQADRAGDPGP